MALRETENRCLCFSYMVIEAGRRGQCRTPYNAEKQYPLSRMAQGVFSGPRNVFDTTNRKICDTLKKMIGGLFHFSAGNRLIY
jgi:hypothetical protein